MIGTESQLKPDNKMEKTKNSITEDDIPEKIETPIAERDMREKSETLTTEAQESFTLSPERPIKHVFKPRVRTPKVLDLRMLDIRVGRVDDVEPVEDEEGVFTLSIDIKKPEHRTASSSLLSATGFDVYDLIDTKVVTVLNAPITYTSDDTECNIRVLGAVRMGGEDGTVVEAVEVLRPPNKSKLGSHIYAEGYVQEHYWAIKEKMYKIIIKDLIVDSENRAVYKESPLRVKGRSGYVTTDTLKDCPITHI